MSRIPGKPSYRLAAVGMVAAVASAAIAFLPAGGAFASASAAQHPAAGWTKVSLDGQTWNLKVSRPAGIKPLHAAAKAAASSAVFVHSSAATGVILPHPVVYLVFWGSQWTADKTSTQKRLTAFFNGLFGASDTWGTIMDQYCEGGGIKSGAATCPAGATHTTHPATDPLAGVFLDTTAAAPAAATIGQLGAEAARAARHFKTSAATNLNAEYVIASPHGTNPDQFNGPNGFCGEHAAVTTTNHGELSFTNLPYVPDLGTGACTTLSPAQRLDGYFSTETHEYAESASDPFPPGNGWLDASGNEIGDLCLSSDARLALTTGTFDVQGIWSDLDGGCVTKGP